MESVEGEEEKAEGLVDMMLLKCVDEIQNRKHFACYFLSATHGNTRRGFHIVGGLHILMLIMRMLMLIK